MTEYEKSIHERFQQEMTEYMEEYREVLREKISERAADDHCGLITYFIEYVCLFESVTGFEQITVAMTNSSFRSHYFSENQQELPAKRAKYVLKGYFGFLCSNFSICLPKLQKGFERA